MNGESFKSSVSTEGSLNPQKVRVLGVEVGFTEAGVVALPHGNQLRDAERFDQWMDAGRGGNMHYLSRATGDGKRVRAQVATPFPWARSAVVCFASYHVDQALSTQPAPVGSGWIARYAWTSKVDEKGVRRPSDYHKILLKRMKALEERLHAELGEFESRAYVDTGPVVERTLAAAAGLGWTGKNTCLIHPKLGSFGFLAVLLTSLELGAEEGPPLAVPDRCGSCTRCIEACPTDALIAPYQMDARMCISYLTIEHKGPIEPALMDGMGRQVFGCDICQDVCPWNRKAPISNDPELEPRAELVNPALEWLAGLDEGAWERLFNGSPVRRAGFQGFRRNLAVAMGNSGQGHFAATLRDWAAAADEGLRAAADWALKKLKNA